MARHEVDAVSLVGLFERVAARAVVHGGGRPVEELGAWPVARAVLEVLWEELGAAGAGPPPGMR